MRVYRIDELTDSQIVYDKNPPAFMKYVLIICLALLIFGGVWANKSIKAYIVKGQGMITSEDKSIIMSKSSGEIINLNVVEGQAVNKGDVLFEIGSNQATLEKQQVDDQIQVFKNRVELLQRAETDARAEKIHFQKMIL